MHRKVTPTSRAGQSGRFTLRRSAVAVVAALCLVIAAAPGLGAQTTSTTTTSTTEPTTTSTTVTPSSTSTTVGAPSSTTSSTPTSSTPTSSTPTSTTVSGDEQDTTTTTVRANPVCAESDDGGDATTSTVEGGTEEVCDPPLFDIDGDGILDPVTPDVDPGQSEDEADGPPPSVAVTVPPPNQFDNAVEWTPSVALVSDLESAREKFDLADARLTQLAGMIQSFRLQSKRLDDERAELDIASQETLEALEQAEVRMRLRAMTAFVDGDEVSFADSADFGRVPADQAQQTVVDIVFEKDRALIAAHEADKSDLAESTTQLHERIRLLERSLAAAEGEVEEARLDLEQAANELKVFEAGSGVYISGVTFPIAWPYSVPLINSWGYPRSGGRRHEGIDIFAEAGTPLVATERGIVTKIGSGTLGGLRLWLRGESGTDWYYAHLSGFAPGLTENQVVEVGELIGYVGNTGNAVGTPPHLHMQIHPNGGDPVNPYPLLKLVSDDEIEARAAAED